MTKETSSSTWGFEPVLDLIRNLSSVEDDSGQRPPETLRSRISNDTSLLEHDSSVPNGLELRLGNFDRIWRYLGQPLNGPLPTITLIDADIPIPSIESGESDGQRDIKAVRWRDEIDGADLADDDDVELPSSTSGMNKQQRKKANRRKRKQALADALASAKLRNKPSASSENESEVESRQPKSPERRSVIHSMLFGSNSKDIQKQSAVTVLKRPQPALDPDRWPVARPHITNGVDRASSAPAESSYAVVAARKAKLIELLNDYFPDERQYLANIGLLPQTITGDKSTSEGIHVFVDASNIMIGFQDAIKALHSLPPTHRLRRQPLSFHSLSLILTRGRPTAKQILVGSDNFPAIQEAKAIGYEINILDRVHKTKEDRSTPKTHRLRPSLPITNGNLSVNGSSHNTSRIANHTSTASASGSDTGHGAYTASSSLPRWTEQAVDEILHLKMLESIVDCGALAPSTMVLATGDAAVAEYSEGFLAQVERALLHGWKVEVVSFRQNTSGLWKRREWRDKWGPAFRMIELDDFVQCLLGVEWV